MGALPGRTQCGSRLADGTQDGGRPSGGRPAEARNGGAQPAGSRSCAQPAGTRSDSTRPASARPVVAVLALQGAFVEHERALARLGCETIELRQATDLARPFDRLVLPGGESTTQGRLLREQGMLETLRTLVEGGMPVLGTCAGLILLAKRVEDEGSSGREQVRPEHHLGTLSVTVRRNAYGRQLGSFHAVAPFEGLGEVPMTFIRAPYVSEVGPDAEALAWVDGHVVAVRQGAQLGVAFHPELDNDLRVHQLFLSL